MPAHQHHNASHIEATLTDHSLEGLVEMVIRPLEPNRYRAATVHGAVEFERLVSSNDIESGYLTHDISGVNPLQHQQPDLFDSLAAELADPHPLRTTNSYPYAFESIAQFFDAAHAPDLLALHTGAHTRDGYLGNHGSLAITQARAPFIAAGAGIATHGTLDASTRVVDLAPTLAALMGLRPHPHASTAHRESTTRPLLARQDGHVNQQLLTGDIADHVVVFLLDGCNPNLLDDAIERGEAPHIDSLRNRGTSYRHGCFASLPTATLANHTTALTGVHPGHSGILHNTWFNRATKHVHDLLDLGQMFWSANHLHPEVETLFEALHRCRPDAISLAEFEFCDRGATISTFQPIRDGAMPQLEQLEALHHLTTDAALENPQYLLGSQIDHHTTRHVIDAWGQSHNAPLPTLTWCGFVLTDEAGHASGPHGELARAAVRDTDARIGDIIDAVEDAGRLDSTAFFVFADHGMQQCDPTVNGSWQPALAETGLVLHDLDGLIYLR